MGNTSGDLREHLRQARQARAAAEQRISELGQEREQALERAQHLQDEILQLSAEALDAGSSMTDLAALSGISRVTLHRHLGSRASRAEEE